MNLYERLKVDKTASQDDVKKAYRKQSTVHHPDKGGDEAEFKLLVVAYNILFDEDKRKRYDSGETPESISRSSRSEDEEVLATAVNLYCQAVQSNNPETSDIIKLMVHGLKLGIEKVEKAIEGENRAIRNYERALSRLRTDKAENIFASSTQGAIAQHKNVIDKCLRDKRIGEKVLNLLDDYSYRVDEHQAVTFSYGGL